MKNRKSQKKTYGPTKMSPLITVELGDFRWLHQDGWEERESDYIMASRARTFLSILKPLGNYVSAKSLRKGHPSDATSHRFVLQRPVGQCIGWADAQEFKKKFHRILLLVSTSSVSKFSDADMAPLSLLISGLFIYSKADYVDVVLEQTDLEERIDSFRWGEMRTVSCFKEFFFESKLEKLPFQSKKVLNISSVDWWNTPHGQRDKKTLAYLIKRVCTD